MRDLAGVQSRDGIPTAKNIIILNWSPSPEPLKNYEMKYLMRRIVLNNFEN